MIFASHFFLGLVRTYLLTSLCNHMDSLDLAKTRHVILRYFETSSVCSLSLCSSQVVSQSLIQRYNLYLIQCPISDYETFGMRFLLAVREAGPDTFCQDIP